MPGPEFNPADDEQIDREEWEAAMECSAVASHLQSHYLMEIHCDHAAKTDEPLCSCGWRGGKHPTVGRAVGEWSRHVAAGIQPSCWLVEKFENGKSIGYYDGGSIHHGFTQAIVTALQFRRKEDAKRVCEFLYGDVRATEHIFCT